MGKRSKVIFLAFLFTFVALKAALASPLSSGSSKIEITPAIGTPMAGYGRHRGKPTVGIHDPLFARALSLTRDGQSFVFVSVDLVLIDEKLRKEVLRKIRHHLPSFKEEQLILFATHTHTGAGAIGGRFWERFIMGKFKKSVFESVTTKISNAALEALQNQIPVTAEYSETRIDDLIENRMDEKLKLPSKLKVFRFKNQQGEVSGFLIFMAAHATLAPAAEFLFSADFPGVFTSKLESAHSNAVAVFVNGAAGDLRPKTPDIQDRWERLNAYGETLADKTNVLVFSTVSFEGPWQGVTQKVKLPRTKIRVGAFKIPSLIGNRVFPNKTYFQVVRLGRFAFITFPGEAAAETGWEIEQAALSKSLTPFFIGYAHDYIGYMVPRRYHRDRSQYESQASFYGEKLEWFFQARVSSLMDSLLTEQEKQELAPTAQLSHKEGLPVLDLKGDAYHVGFEEGRLLSKEIQQGTDDIFAYFRRQLPIPLLNRLIINRMANRAWKKMEPFVSYSEFQQMKGLADGSGVSFKRIKQIHAMPEIYPTLCANGAYWGKATADGRLIALRNLDWNRDMGIQNRAAVKWIETPGRKAYANIGYYGFAGVLSGLNEKGISVGQIGATSSDETMEGTPMPFLLKRVLENAANLEDAINVFQIYPRTRGYNYVITDAIAKNAVVLEATQHHLAIFEDEDPREKEIPYSLVMENALFRGDPALDPQIRDLQIASKGNPKKAGLEMPGGSAYEIRYKKQGELAQTHYGKLTPERLQQIAAEIAPGSNIQSVIYAYPDFWVANAKSGKKATDSGYVRLNVEELKDAS